MWKYIISTWLLALSLFAQAQPCVAHLDKSFYVAGETIWFKLYLPQAGKGKHAAIRAVLLDSRGEVADYFFLATEGKTWVQGYYSIPYAWTSGMYRLIFAAQEAKSKASIPLAVLDIPVYNDLEKHPGPEAISQPVVRSGKQTLGELNVEITLEKAVYQSREQVSGSIRVSDAAGAPVRASASLAVTDWSLAGETVWDAAPVRQGFAFPEAVLETQPFYRMRHVKNTGQQAFQNVLMGVYAAQDWQIRYAAPEESGLFYVEFPPFYGEKNIQALAHPMAEISVMMDDPLRNGAGPALEYTPGILQYLELSRQRKKAFQLFTALEGRPEIQILEQPVFTLAPDRSLRVADYQAFEDMAVFFKELRTPLLFTQDRKTGRFSAKVYNPSTLEHYAGAPLFVLDGKVTRDADYIARLKMSQIEQVDLYYQLSRLQSQFKVLGNNGVVVITSKAGLSVPEPDANAVFLVKGLQPSATFPAFSPEVAQAPNQPLFRPQLYWNPTLETDAQGRTAFRFIQSDDKSTFRIQVVVQSADGRMGYGVLEYIVEE